MHKTTTLFLNKDFKRLYYRGRSCVDPALVTYAMKNHTDHNRIGITVTKKIGKAVSRNRCKRIIRAAYQILEPQFPSGWDFIFVARGKTKAVKSTQLVPIMKQQVETLTKPKKSPQNPDQQRSE